MTSDLDRVFKILNDLAEKINNAIFSKENIVLALDYAYVHQRPGEYKNTSYILAVEGYDKILKKFIDQYGSLLNTIQNEKKYSNLNNDKIQKGLELISHPPYRNIVAPKNIATFHNLSGFLEKSDIQFGKFLLWLNANSKYKDYTINISFFLILNKHICESDIVEELFDIFNQSLFSDGVAFLLEDYEYELLQSEKLKKRNEELKSFQNEIDNYAHNIFNIFPDILNGFESVQETMLLNSNEYLKIEKELKRARLLQIFFKIIGGREIKEIKGKTVWEMIKMLEDLDKSNVDPILSPNSIELEKPISSVDYIPGNIDAANNTFNVLWNFWHNARKYSKHPNFFVSASKDKDYLVITFKNIGTALSKQNCDFLMKKVDKPSSIRGEKSGLAISDRKMGKLGWVVLSATSRPYEKNKSLWINEIIIRTNKETK